MSEEVLTPEQVADYLQLHTITILKMIKRGDLKAVRIGRVYRILEKDLKEFLQGAKILIS